MFSINNSVRLIGRLGQDPEVRTVNSGSKVARFSLATNGYYKNKEGEKVEDTTWHNIVCWGPRADFAEKYLHKGREISLEGQLKTRSYETQDGVTKYITEVVLNEVKLFAEASVLQD